MATHDYVLDNATGANFRSDLNNVLAAIVSNNSSSSEPSTKYAYQWWADTNEGVLKIRNSANDGWVTLLQLDGTLTLEDGTASAPALGFRDDLNTGIFSSAADNLDITTGGTTRVNVSSTGINVTGTVVDDGATHDGDVTFTGASANIVFDKSDNQLEFADNAKAEFGTGGDLEIYHDGTDNHIVSTNGQINIQTSSTEDSIQCIPDAQVKLFYNGVLQVSTSSTGIIFADDKKANFGGESDLSIYHDGSNSYIDDSGTGNLLVRGNNIELHKYTGEDYLKCIANGAVELYFDNAKKAETVTGGFTVTGTCTATAFAGDGSALTGVGGGVTSDSQGNTVAGTNAGDSFDGTNAENNTLIGKDAGTAITTGDLNTSVGFDSAKNTTTGGSNTAVGGKAFRDNTTGSDNTAIGKSALISNTTASNNTAVGKEALANNTTGDANTAMGSAALDACTTGSNNTAFGNNALGASTTQIQNTAVGRSALSLCTSNYNTAVGFEAARDLTSGDQLAAFGFQACALNTTGINNTGHGYKALLVNTTGSHNTAVGCFALDANTTAGENTAIGFDALGANTEGARNVAVGNKALDANTTANQNTAIGYDAMGAYTTGYSSTAVGHGALDTATTPYNNNAFGVDSERSLTSGVQNCAFGNDTLAQTTTGNHNTAIGHNAGNDVTTGGSNIFLGINAGDGQVTTAHDNLFIARSGVAAGNGACFIYGNTSGSCFQGDNTSNWSTTSDQRLKKDISTNTVGLSIINNVTVRNFKYKQYSDGSPVTTDDTVDISEFPDADNLNQVLIGQGNTETHIGIIAQELETVAPNCVSTSNRGVKTVVTDELFWHMLNAIKELSTKVTALEAG